jgi:ADP-heptose:LPS heptosyltransferase
MAMAGTSPSALVIRLDAIGDALALTPLLAALHDRGLPVDVVLTEVNARIFSARAARRSYVAPFALRSSTRENLHAIARFGAELRANAYTHVLVATEDPGGYRLASAVGAPKRIGFANGWGKPFKTLWVRTLLNRIVIRSAGLDPGAPHECDVLFSLGEELLNGTQPTHDAQRLSQLILDEGVPRSERIAFQVTDKWRRLGISDARVLDAFRRAANHGVVRAIASRSEAEYARAFAQQSGSGIEIFDSLEPWKRAVAASAAVVAPDSGAVHLAGMVGTPVVAVFPPAPEFTLQTSRWTPWASSYRIVRAEGAWPAEIGTALDALLHADQRHGNTLR